MASPASIPAPQIRYSLSVVSDIVQRFERIAADRPERPLIYAPATNDVLTASHLWQSHLEIRQQLWALGIQPGQLVVSAAGNRPFAVPLVLACLSLRVPLMPIDASATATEVAQSAERFGAFAVAMPDGSNHRLVRQPADPSAYGDAALLKLTSGSTGFPKAILTAESHMIADAERIIQTMAIAGQRYADCDDSVVTLVWIRQSRDAASAARHGHGAEGFVRSEPDTRRCSRISGSRVRGRTVHVQLLDGESAAGRLAILFAVAHFRRRTARYAGRRRRFTTVSASKSIRSMEPAKQAELPTMQAMR